MAFFEFVVACILALFGAWMCFFLSWTLIRETLPFFRGSARSSSPSAGFSRKLKKAQKKVERIDDLIRDKEFLTALKELEQAFVFVVSESPQLVRAHKEHNQAMLSRCLVVGEHLGTRSQNLPRVEKLMLERVELQLLRLKTKDTFKNIASKREQRGKALPSWSRSEHQRKMKDIEEELKRNRRELDEAIETLFRSLQNASPQEDITYH